MVFEQRIGVVYAVSLSQFQICFLKGVFYVSWLLLTDKMMLVIVNDYHELYYILDMRIQRQTFWHNTW